MKRSSSLKRVAKGLALIVSAGAVTQVAASARASTGPSERERPRLEKTQLQADELRIARSGIVNPHGGILIPRTGNVRNLNRAKSIPPPTQYKPKKH
jgi:hypothetical protein